MAYLKCPWCLTPQLIDDDAAEYRCFTCYADVRFFECPHCQWLQTVGGRWAAFICGKCEQKVDLPYRWGYAQAARALGVRGTAHPFPRL